jgi:hypothetical protein
MVFLALRIRDKSKTFILHIIIICSSKFIFKETLKVPKSTGKFPSQLENDLGHYLRPVEYKQNSSDIALGSSMVTPKVGSSDYDSLDIQIAYLISLKKYLAYQHENDPS